MAKQDDYPIYYPRPLRHLSIYLAGLVAGRLWLKVLIGLGLGLVVGTLLGPRSVWLNLPPDPDRQLAGVPRAAVSRHHPDDCDSPGVAGIWAWPPARTWNLRRLGLRVTLFFVVTTGIAASIGLWVGGVLSPGTLLAGLAQTELPPGDPTSGAAMPAVEDLPRTLIGLLPGNPLDAMVEGQMLQIVIFSIIVGIALVSMPPDKARPMLDLLDSLQQVCMTVVKWAMRLAPLAVFGLMAQLTTTIGFRSMLGMGAYVLTVLAGLLLLLGVYLLFMKLAVGYPPLRFIRDSRDVLLLAFSTSSSAAVMPCPSAAEDKLGVRPSISQFVIPLGATINMNGTALYQAVATIPGPGVRY